MALHLAGRGSAAFDMYFCNHFVYPSRQLELVGLMGMITIHRAEASGPKVAVSVYRAQRTETLALPPQTPRWELSWIDEFLQTRTPPLWSNWRCMSPRLRLRRPHRRTHSRRLPSTAKAQRFVDRVRSVSKSKQEAAGRMNLVQDQSTELLRNQITRGRIPPGTKRVERKLAALLGNSPM